jgi:TetR/AcrR family transcriptional regulator, transcriptional repressor for nem operon
MRKVQKSELTKDLIVNESFKLFYENGFNATSIDKIVEAAQLTKGAFYYHYKNKKELVLDVISINLQKRVYESMISPLYQPGDVVTILKSTFSNRINSFSMSEKEHGCPMNNLINEIADNETAYQLTLSRIIEEWKAALVNIVERGKKEGAIKDSVLANSVAVYLISAYEGVRGLRKLYNDDAVLDEYLDGLFFYLDSLKK